MHFQLVIDLNSTIRCECPMIQTWLRKINLVKLCIVVNRSFEIGIQFTWMFLFLSKFYTSGSNPKRNLSGFWVSKAIHFIMDEQSLASNLKVWFRMITNQISTMCKVRKWTMSNQVTLTISVVPPILGIWPCKSISPLKLLIYWFQAPHINMNLGE
jgi:hypothetical protein